MLPYVHIIAEAGTNHNGDAERARALIDLAARAGADSVKLQIINPDELYLPGEYKYGHYDINAVRAMRRRFMLTDDAYRELAGYAGEQGIGFSASVFDEKGLDLLAGLNPPYVKVASTDLNNVRFLRRVAERGIRVVLSTGMSSLGDIEKAVRAVLETGFEDLVLMHCVSAYPVGLAECNLAFIDVLKSAFGFPVGFSDHTESTIAAALAISKGIAFLEKHFTEDRTQKGFDHAYAAEGQQFVDYVAALRETYEALKPCQQKLKASELHVRERARRSLYAARDLAAGDRISDEDVLIVRPENIMAADEIDEVVGRTLRKPVGRYESFSRDVLG